MTYFIIFAIVVLILILILTKVKRLKLDAVTMINGGVKCGKTTLAVALAIKKHKRNHLIWKIKKYLRKLLRINKEDEEPLLYSNIPLNYPYVPLTTDIIDRTKRCNYKSVVLISEMSLVIDSMSYDNPIINEQVTLFIKLFGHSTRGGSAFLETQALGDNHYAIKRCIGRYFWIHSLCKFIPFVLVYKVREMLYSDSNSMNTFNEDIEDSTKLVIISKSVWKKFDTYCYSTFTDSLERVSEVVKADNLKCESIVSFKQYYTIPNERVKIPLKIRKEKRENAIKQ